LMLGSIHMDILVDSVRQIPSSRNITLLVSSVFFDVDFATI
jgi:hypothetical protein